MLSSSGCHTRGTSCRTWYALFLEKQPLFLPEENGYRYGTVGPKEKGRKGPPPPLTVPHSGGLLGHAVCSSHVDSSRVGNYCEFSQSRAFKETLPVLIVE